MSYERHKFQVHAQPDATEFEFDVEYLSVFFPEIGTMTITFESPTHRGGLPQPIIQCDFDPTKDHVRVIDERGNDRQIT